MWKTLSFLHCFAECCKAGANVLRLDWKMSKFPTKNLFFHYFVQNFLTHLLVYLFSTCLVHNGLVKRPNSKLAALWVLIESRCESDNNQHQSCKRSLSCDTSNSVSVVCQLPWQNRIEPLSKIDRETVIDSIDYCGWKVGLY